MQSPIGPLTCAALLFDLDGVLVDSTACVEDTWRRWAAEHPEGYLTAAARLGIAPAMCLVVEDAPAGLAAAHAAGMRSLAVATTHPPADLAEADLIAAALSAVTVRVERSDDSEVLRVAVREESYGRAVV